MEFSHRSVLLEPTVNALVDRDFGLKGKRKGIEAAPDALAEGVYVDGTFGRGGHSRLLLTRLAKTARLVVFDKDPEAIAVAEDLLREDERIVVVHGGFVSMPEQLR
jgi:16S rRNA (cytosine1402-N4)-methyltransferase